MIQAVTFKNFSIPVVNCEGKNWVSVRHVCEALGVAYQGQHEKLKSSIEYMCQDILTRDTVGRNQRMFCISAGHAHLWIAGISSAKVSPDIREQFIAYKHECANVIYNHFNAKGQDFIGITQQLKEINDKIDHLTGIDATVFGDDAPVIKELINKASNRFGMTNQEVWGLIRKECDVSSYKCQNRKIINFLKNLLGEGLRLVKEENPE